MRIGNAKNARLLAEYVNSKSYTSERPPNSDWSFLGSGWSRHAFLGPDEVVYKVGYNYVNREERHNVSVLSNIEHPTIKVPRCTTWKVEGVGPFYKSQRDKRANHTLVNAMEYIKGKRGYPQQEVEDIRKYFGVEDCFGGNFIKTDTGVTYLIDLGEGRKRISKDGRVVGIESS